MLLQSLALPRSLEQTDRARPARKREATLSAQMDDPLCACWQTAFAELLGCAASCGYLALLMREVDGVTPDTRVPLAAAERVAQQPARALALALAAYRCAAGSSGTWLTSKRAALRCVLRKVVVRWTELTTKGMQGHAEMTSLAKQCIYFEHIKMAAASCWFHGSAMPWRSQQASVQPLLMPA